MSGSKRPVVAVISGIIGAGKTTLLKLLGLKLSQKGIKVVIIKEPIEEVRASGILDAFYNDISRWGYTIQTKFFESRVISIKKAHHENPDADLFILERSPWDDKIFMKMLYESNKVNEIEWNLYNSWCNLWEQLMPFSPDLFLYLKPSIVECQRRIKERGRGEETSVSEDYQRDLEKYHDDFFNSGAIGISGELPKIPDPCFKESLVLLGSLLVPCYEIATNANFRDHPEEQEIILGVFLKILEKHQ
jgi:deoxyadenosine/deoxycytidine kinase